MMFWIFLIVTVALRLWQLIRKFNAQTYTVSEDNTRNFNFPPFDDLRNERLWDERARKYDAATTQKRRMQVTCQYNEMITRGLFKTGYESDESALRSKLQGFGKNPAKHFSAGVWLFLMLNASLAWAQSANDTYKQAESLYKNNEYAQAAQQYQQVLAADSSFKTASVLYKTALCYQKLKDCNTAKNFFAKALQASPADGGASSISKFTEKLRGCNLSVSDLTLSNALGSSAENNVSNSSSGNKDLAKELYQKADNLYDSKQYDEAINQYKEVLAADSGYKRATTFYKIGLAYQKKKNCGDAKTYFSRAYEANPETGGASSLSKFKEKATKCGWSATGESASSSGAASSEDYSESSTRSSGLGWFMSMLLAIPLGLLLAWLIFLFYKRKKGAEKEEQLRQALTAAIHDDNYWMSLEARYNPVKIQFVRELFVQHHQEVLVSNDIQQIATLHSRFNQFKENPESFFEHELNISPLVGLLTQFKGTFYCFFTAEAIPEGRAMVVAIRHQNGAERKVWTTSRMLNKIQMNAKIKVRVHQINGEWVHWSKDTTWSNALAAVSANEQLQASWQGQSSEIEVFELYEIFTDKLTNYMAPHLDAIVQGVLQFRDDSSQATGYQNQTNPSGGSSDRWDDVITGALIGSQVRGMLDHDHDHHHSRHHDRDVS